MMQISFCAIVAISMLIFKRTLVHPAKEIKIDDINNHTIDTGAGFTFFASAAEGQHLTFEFKNGDDKNVNIYSVSIHAGEIFRASGIMKQIIGPIGADGVKEMLKTNLEVKKSSIATPNIKHFQINIENSQGF
jgi:hypothetical protein